MPTTTTKGYKIPIDGERGTWWDNLEFNIQRLNDHDHDGSDSQSLVGITAVTLTEQAVPAGSWVAVAGQAGTYRQLITLAGSAVMTRLFPKFYVDGGGEDGAELFLTWEKASANTYYVYINDNTLSLKAKYA